MILAFGPHPLKLFYRKFNPNESKSNLVKLYVNANIGIISDEKRFIGSALGLKAYLLPI